MKGGLCIMKKTYTKPYLAVESFQLDAAIATSCSEQNKPVLSDTKVGLSDLVV